MKPKYYIATLILAALMAAGPALIWRRPQSFFKRFLQEIASPFPLAFFRITFFLSCFFFIEIDAVRYSRLPSELMFPPFGWNAILSIIPIRPSDTWYISVLFKLCLLFSAAGLWTRASVMGSVLTGIWMLGIPQFFGKINHIHHLIWFMAIFAVSPCADVLSIDALVRARKRADHGVIQPPGDSVAYALPLKAFWLLLGATYFWTGFWKAWTGPEWAFSDSMRYLLYNKWAELNWWLPGLRIDHYPWVYRFAAAGTIAFEMGFIVLMLHRHLRHLAIALGMGFHNSTLYFMKIGFFHLQFSYVCLVDWTRVWRWLGERLFPVRLQMLYDGNCQLCRRTMAMVRTLDVFDRIDYINALDPQGLGLANAAGIPEQQLVHDICALEGNRVSSGYDAYVRMSLRIPVIWPIIPLLYVPVVRNIGMKLYRRVADARTCALPQPMTAVPTSRPERRWIVSTVAVGYGLIVLVNVCSLLKFHSWPLAGYPTFEGLQVPRIEILKIRASTASEDREVSVQALAEKIGIDSARLVTLTSRIIALPESPEKARRFCALWGEVSSAGQLPGDAKLTFYQDVVSTLPEDRDSPPLERKVVFTTQGCPVQVSDLSDVARRRLN